MNDMEYRYFFEVARTLNFNQAAENLFMTQPALSKCILKLEQQFGVKLFTRSKRQVRLTDAGMALLNHYPLVQKAEHELYEKVRNASRGLHMRLSVGVQEGHLVPSALRNLMDSFCKENKDIQMDVISSPYIRLFEQLNSRELDLAFALEFPGNIYPNIRCKVIETKESYALVGKNHPAALAFLEEGSDLSTGGSDMPRELQLLQGADLLLVKWSIVPNATSYILNQCHANGIVPANIHYAPDYLTLYNWLIMGKGFAIMDKGSIFSEEHIAYLPLQKEKNIHWCVYGSEEAENAAMTRFLRAADMEFS